MTPAGILEALGKVYLYEDKIEEGTKNIELAIKANPDNQILLPDPARYHGYSIYESIAARPGKALMAGNILQCDRLPVIK